MSIDDRYQFVINPNTHNKDVYNDNEHANNNNISHLVNKLKHIVQLRVLKSFYKMRMLKS